jgi:hypothetical protein
MRLLAMLHQYLSAPMGDATLLLELRCFLETMVRRRQEMLGRIGSVKAVTAPVPPWKEGNGWCWSHQSNSAQNSLPLGRVCPSTWNASGPHAPAPVHGRPCAPRRRSLSWSGANQVWCAAAGSRGANSPGAPFASEQVADQVQQGRRGTSPLRSPRAKRAPGRARGA